MADISVPSFKAVDIDLDRTDGYFVYTFYFSKDDEVPGVVVFRMDSGAIAVLDNPLATNPKAILEDSWTKQVIATYPKPTAVVAFDVTGNGLSDLVVSYQLGPSMLGCDPDGGIIVWLENPGRENLGHQEPWRSRYIGQWPAMHRLTAGKFTQRDKTRLMTGEGETSADDQLLSRPILLFSPPADVSNAGDAPGGRDSFYVASREGLSRLYYSDDQKWQSENISAGLPKAPNQDPNSETPGMGDFWGTGGADTGRIGENPRAYIASVEPFHGFKVAVYVKSSSADTASGQQQQEWTRHVLDDYGSPTQRTKTAAGPLHYVVCGDFDGQCSIAFYRRYAETDHCQGIMYYKAINLANGIFAKWRISERTSGRIALGNFTKSAKIDLASIDFSMKSYREEPAPRVQLLINNTTPAKTKDMATSITGTVWDNEGLVSIPEPTKISSPSTLPLITVADYAITVEVHPPNSTVEVTRGNSLKALYSSLLDSDKNTWRPLGTDPFPSKQSVAVGNTPDSADDDEDVVTEHDWAMLGNTTTTVTTDATKGAIFLRLHRVTNDGLWSSVDKVPVDVTFQPHAGLTLPDLRFQKAEDLWWGGAAFKGLEYYNLRGFDLRFTGDKGPIAHLQFWAAGKNVNTHFQKHTDTIVRELGICFSSGTKDGGIWVPNPEDANRLATELDMLQAKHGEKFVQVPLGELEENGTVWQVNEQGEAVRGWQDVVVYPWHAWRAGGGENLDVWMTVGFDADLDLGVVETKQQTVAMR
ncbi:hypothetical protein BDV06DRAFT_233183 [Aspergillus oleicola]